MKANHKINTTVTVFVALKPFHTRSFMHTASPIYTISGIMRGRKNTF